MMADVPNPVPAPAPPPTKPRRVLALDALRGFAILTMVLSGVVPWSGLPAWMYHAQLPPPDHAFNPNLPGLTWVDLVFPFFLFSMGAAFPLALSRRIDKGASRGRILLGILERGFLLGTFGVFLDHIRPYALNNSPTSTTWLLAILGFALLCLMYTRFPDSWNAATRWGLKLLGWGGAILFCVYFWGARFSSGRQDIIIIILTNIAVFGSIVWLLTRGNLLLRLGVMGLVVALRLGSTAHGWVQDYVWSDFLLERAQALIDALGLGAASFLILFIRDVIHIGMNSYLLIALPGSIAGDLLLKWASAGHEPARAMSWSVSRLWGIAVVMVGFVVVCLVGLQGRWVLPTAALCLALALVGWLQLHRPGNPAEQFLKTLFLWGVYWLAIGLVFEPYEGGIKKDPATFSYFFLTSGLAFFTLVFFTIVIDILRHERWVHLLVANGQNPMIAYVAHGNLLLPLMNLTGIGLIIDKMTPGPWLGTLRAFFVTFLVAVIVWLFTRKKIFWRT